MDTLFLRVGELTVGALAVIGLATVMILCWASLHSAMSTPEKRSIDE